MTCASLVEDGDDALYTLSVDDAVGAALNKERAEENALAAAFANGGKFTFRSETPNCGACRACLDKTEFGGGGTLKKACYAKDPERHVALLALVSGRPPPSGTSWQPSKSISGTPTKTKATRRGPRRALCHAVGDTVLAKWEDGSYYEATVTTARVRSVDVVFVADGKTRLGVPVGDLRRDDDDDDDDDDEPRPKRPRNEARRTPASTGDGDQVPTCMICLSQLYDDATYLDCDHAFHGDCLKGLASAVRIAASTRRSAVVSCPLCRKITRPLLDSDAADAPASSPP